MTGSLLAAGVLTLALLVALDGADNRRCDRRRWLLSRARLMPGVLLASVAVAAAGVVDPAQGLPRWVEALAPVAVVVLFVLAVWTYTRHGKIERGVRD
ncbi:MAG: hypothetical protein ACRDQW_08975 [Haloechinothrix sp.]